MANDVRSAELWDSYSTILQRNVCQMRLSMQCMYTRLVDSFWLHEQLCTAY